MKAIVSSISIGRDRQREICLRFPAAMFGDSAISDVRFTESKLGIVGLQLGDELEFQITLKP